MSIPTVYNQLKLSAQLIYSHTYFQIPVEAIFSAPSRPALGPTQPPSQWVTRLLPGVNRLERGVNHPLPSSAKITGRIPLFLYSPPGPSLPVLERPLRFKRIPRSQTFTNTHFRIPQFNSSSCYILCTLYTLHNTFVRSEVSSQHRSCTISVLHSCDRPHDGYWQWPKHVARLFGLYVCVLTRNLAFWYKE